MKDIPLLSKDDIEVKVKQVGPKGALALLYKTARVDMAILDDVFGPMNWQVDYKEIKGNLYCGIGIRESCDSPFVWKWDCGIESRSDNEGHQRKGEASDAFKRAGFKVGIGRELYSAPFIYLKVETEKDAKGNYVLKNRFAKFSVLEVGYDRCKKINRLAISDEKNEIVYTYGCNPKGAGEEGQQTPTEDDKWPLDKTKKDLLRHELVRTGIRMKDILRDFKLSSVSKFTEDVYTAVYDYLQHLPDFPNVKK